MHSIVYGVGVYNSVIITRMINSTCNAFFSLTQYISSETDHKHVYKQLSDLDLEYRVSIINELVKDCCNNDNELIHKAVLGLNDILGKINKELQQIDELIRNHSKKYFNSWRDFNCDGLIDEIKHHKKILEERYKILIDLLNLYK